MAGSVNTRFPLQQRSKFDMSSDKPRLQLFIRGNRINKDREKQKKIY